MNNENIIAKQINDYEYFLGNIGIVSSEDVNNAIRENKITELIELSEIRHYEMIKDCCSNILAKKIANLSS